MHLSVEKRLEFKQAPHCGLSASICRITKIRIHNLHVYVHRLYFKENTKKSSHHFDLTLNAYKFITLQFTQFIQ